MSAELAIEYLDEILEEIDSIESRLDVLRTKNNKIISALEHGEDISASHTFSKSKKLLKYINNPSDFNWCQISTSIDHSRTVLCFVIVQDGVMYGTNGISINYCDTDLEDGVYESEGVTTKMSLNPPNIKNVIASETKIFKKFNIEKLKSDGDTVEIFNRKFDRSLFDLIITDKKEFKASVNKNGVLTIDLGSGRKGLIMRIQGGE